MSSIVKRDAVQHGHASWFVLGLMASVTFVGILSELVPSGILPQMTLGLAIGEAEVGFLVGVYALAAAFCAIPLVSMTLAVNRKALLMALLIGFSASNIVVGITSSYPLVVAMRIVGGVCAGVMWPMIAAYGTALVPPPMHGRTITLIMSGNTLGISLGLPVMTLIGTEFGWRTAFVSLGAVVAIIALLSARYLPSVDGEALTRNNSPLAVLKNGSVLIVLVLTFLSVIAHYGAYTYITLLVEKISFTGGTSLALFIFGVGSVISVILSARVIDLHLRGLVIGMLALGTLSMTLLAVLGDIDGISHLAFFLWGVAFGPLVTMYQTAVSKHVVDAKAVATSVQSSIFNLSIMIATWMGGLILTRLPHLGAQGVLWLSILTFVPAVILSVTARRTLSP